VDGGRDDVVAALTAVDVIVGVHRIAQHAGGEGRDHLIGVHVGAGAGAGLENVHGEMGHVIAGQQFLAGGHDSFALPFGNLLELKVGLGGSSFCQQQRADELARHAQLADREVVHRTLGLRAVQGLGRDLQLAHAVAFNTGITHR
jgi:hypothetical protein